MRSQKLKPILFWEGFPACGLLLKKVIDVYKDIPILASRPAVPFKNLEELLGKNIYWLDDPNYIWEIKDEFSDRNFVVHTGWNHPGWLQYGSFVKQKNGAKIVVVVDNRFRNDFRQKLGALYFRMVLKKNFDAAFVPGREGQRLMHFLGMPRNRIYVGNYGAYEEIYFSDVPILDRNNEFLFVGQLNQRKGVDVMLEAFKKYRSAGGSWDLRILGDGILRNECVGEGIKSEGFIQPHNVALAMNNSKVFVLISRDDNWGTVVCEAMACGMNVITSRNVGASIDMVRQGINGIVLSDINANELASAFHYYEQLDNQLLEEGSEVSKGIVKGYDSKAYYTSFRKMAYDLLGC